MTERRMGCVLLRRVSAPIGVPEDSAWPRHTTPLSDDDIAFLAEMSGRETGSQLFEKRKGVLSDDPASSGPLRRYCSWEDLPNGFSIPRR